MQEHAYGIPKRTPIAQLYSLVYVLLQTTKRVSEEQNLHKRLWHELFR